MRGRLDAVLIASLIGPVTTHIGLVPDRGDHAHRAVPPRVGPVHAGLRQPWPRRVAAAGVGPAVRGRARRTARAAGRGHRSTRHDPTVAALIADLFEEAADAVEVVRRLWDSWEDDAIIKDQATGRYIDRDKLHYVDFEGRFFSVNGPSIVPRPPQGQPLVAALAHSRVPFEFAARSADVVFVTPRDTDDVPRWVGRHPHRRAGRRARRRAAAHLRRPRRVPRRLDGGGAASARQHLDRLDGAPYRSDAAVFVGTPDELAEQLLAWQQHGLVGFRLRPGVIDHDLDAIVDGLVPALQARGAFRTEYAEHTLRPRLGLRPAGQPLRHRGRRRVSADALTAPTNVEWSIR